MSEWNDPATAVAYDRYSKNFDSYQVTSRDLVQLAGVGPGSRVVDLACGTGVTSRAVLAVLGDSGHLYAVDGSAAMLALARENVQAVNVTFFQANAESLHEILPHPIEFVVCNSAFWQMDGDKTLQSIGRVLGKDGRFAFNIPGSFSPVCEDKKRPVNLRALMRQVAEEEFGFTFEKPLRERSSSAFTGDKIEALLARNGFQLLHQERKIYQGDRESAKAFCAIPIMTESTLPGVDYETRLEILERAYHRLEPSADSELIAWDFYLATFPNLPEA